MLQIETAVGFAEPTATKTLLNSNQPRVTHRKFSSQTDILTHIFAWYADLDAKDAQELFGTRKLPIPLVLRIAVRKAGVP